MLELGFLCENSDDVGTISASFAYNAHCSTASMPHLSAMDWDFAEILRHITRGTTEAYYNYDGNGIRTRKVVEKNGTMETRLYLGGFEIWRKTVNGVLDTERETLHVMDDKRRIAIVETLTLENGNRAANPVPVQRYQLDNHLGSTSLELDGSANIISYEEYYPYGDTSYRAGRSTSEVSQKRYRYTGKEKDEESGLYYHGARYYACWLGRWTAADPIGIGDGLNVYMYVHGNPLSGVDPSGTGTVENDEQLINASKEKERTQKTVDGDNLANAFSNDENEKLPVASEDRFMKEAMDMITFVDKAIKKYKIDKFIEKMVYHHLSMVRENKNDKENHKEISAIGTKLRNLNTVYIGFYDKARGTHTMGSEFRDSLNVSTETFRNSNPNGKMLVFHLHPWQNAEQTSFLDKIDRLSMFSSPGDHENMKDGQIWVGIEVLTNKDGSYFYDVHVSGKALGKRSIRIYSQEVDINKCVPQHFKKQIQMTK